jgi:hypothetical protein
MKTSYLCHRFLYPPERGSTIRPFNMIRHFTELGHQVYVACWPKPKQKQLLDKGV